MATRKVTISLEADDLMWLERRAKRLNGGNLSAAFVEGVHALRRREALQDFLRMSKAAKLTSDDAAELLAEIRGDEAPPKPRRRSSHRAA